MSDIQNFQLLVVAIMVVFAVIGFIGHNKKKRDK
jgi:hypothetical protein